MGPPVGSVMWQMLQCLLHCKEEELRAMLAQPDPQPECIEVSLHLDNLKPDRKEEKKEEEKTEKTVQM